MIIKIEDTSEFSDFITDNIEWYDYRYKYLVNVFDAIYNHEIEINVNSFIKEEDDCWIIFLEIKGQFLFMDLIIQTFRSLTLSKLLTSMNIRALK